MKHSIQILFILAIISSLISCKEEKIEGVNAYNQMLEDSFDFLMEGCIDEPTIYDTLYTKMYIALKTCGNHQSHMVYNEVCDSFYAMYNQLQKIDTNDIWLSECTKMKVIVLSLQGRKDEARIANRENYYRMPKDSWERASCLGTDYYVLGMDDSAEYYLELCIKLCDSIIEKSDENKERLEVIGNKWNCLALLNRDKEAMSFVDSMIRCENDAEILDFLEGIRNEKNAPEQMRGMINKLDGVKTEDQMEAKGEAVELYRLSVDKLRDGLKILLIVGGCIVLVIGFYMVRVCIKNKNNIISEIARWLFYLPIVIVTQQFSVIALGFILPYIVKIGYYIFFWGSRFYSPPITSIGATIEQTVGYICTTCLAIVGSGLIAGIVGRKILPRSDRTAAIILLCIVVLFWVAADCFSFWLYYKPVWWIGVMTTLAYIIEYFLITVVSSDD